MKIRVYKKLTCPRCSSKMLLQKGRTGLFYGCSKFNSNGCHGLIQSDDCGNPLKGDEKSRIARLKAKMTIESLWQNQHLSKEDIKKIFEDLCKKINIKVENFNINSFSMTRCRVVRLFLEQKINKIGEKTTRTKTRRRL